jgi:hypothetical protein
MTPIIISQVVKDIITSLRLLGFYDKFGGIQTGREGRDSEKRNTFSFKHLVF